jgi:hypothetical protein
MHSHTMQIYIAGLRCNGRNREDFAGFFVQDDGHVFVAGVEREEADFGFVDGFGG